MKYKMVVADFDGTLGTAPDHIEESIKIFARFSDKRAAQQNLLLAGGLTNQHQKGIILFSFSKHIGMLLLTVPVHS